LIVVTFALQFLAGGRMELVFPHTGALLAD